MTKWLAMLVSCLALGLAIAACGDDEEDSGGGAADTESPAQQGGSQESASPAKKVEVAIKDFSFKPQSLEVAKGTTVTWTNEDSAGHDVTKTGGPGPEFSSGEGDMQKGDTYEQTFTTAGTIRYECTIHPGME